MLTDLFLQVLDLTKAASFVILLVLLARLLLKKAPKVFSYALWAVVLFRLLCPVSLPSPASLLPEMTPVAQRYTLADAPISPAGAGYAAYHAVGDALNGGLGVQVIPTTLPDGSGGVRTQSALWWEVWVLFGQYVWLAGLGVMALYALFSWLKLRRSLQTASHLREDLWLADGIPSPFVLGLARPKIYLPSQLSEGELPYIVLHERHHIRRGDHTFKALGFLALCIHWFNPLVWVAFVLAARDMEMSCDEAVVAKLGEGVLREYSASLVNLAAGRTVIAGMPLAFGEGDTKGRVRNLARWKRPKWWIVAVAAVICLIAGLCLMTDPQSSMTAQQALDRLEADVTRDREHHVLVTIPAFQGQWRVHVTGRAVEADGFSHSLHYGDGELGTPGQVYDWQVADNAVELYLHVTLTTPDGTVLERTVDLLALPPNDGPVQAKPMLGELDRQDMDIDGDGVVEQCVLGNGQTSGVYSVVLTASVGERVKYSEIYVIRFGQVTLEQDGQGPFIRSLQHDGRSALYRITLQEGALRLADPVVAREVPYPIRVSRRDVPVLSEPTYDGLYVQTLAPGSYEITQEVQDADGLLWGKVESGWVEIDFAVAAETAADALPVTVVYGEDHLLTGLKMQQAVIEQSDYATKLLVQTTRNVHEVTLCQLDFTPKGDYVLGEPLHTVPDLMADEALFFTVVFHGDMTTYGLSFTETDGTRRHLAIYISGRNGQLVVSEFRP